MVTRGSCSFAEKAVHVQNAGGKGVIIINNMATGKEQHKKSKRAKSKAARDRRYVMTDDTRGRGKLVEIPVVMVSREDATMVHRQLTQRSKEQEDKDDGDTASGVRVTLSAWLY
jgi:hypothetical protein